MIDTSALVSLGISRVFDEVTSRLDLHTTDVVVDELEEMSQYNDPFAESAIRCLETIRQSNLITEHEIDVRGRDLHSKIDRGELSCVDLYRELEADYLVTDDHRASAALEDYVGGNIVFSPILLKALTKKGIITEREAVAELKTMAEHRNWFDSPLYQYGLQLFG